MLQNLLKSNFARFIVLFYVVLAIWWLKILFFGKHEGNENFYFGAVYPILGLVGGINGFFVSRQYGGISSVMGRGIIFLSLALLGQVSGQFIWSYYNIIAHIEVPYPSIADIGYFSVIPFNILAMLSFAKAAGATLSLKTFSSYAQIIIIPVVLLLIVFFSFLKGYTPDYSNVIKIFLDFGYPIGEVLYISLAILTFTLSKKLLGGVMRSRIIFLISAFILQFITDYSFLYTASRNIYYNAGPVDLMYATSFAVYSLALLNLNFIDTE